MKQHKEEINGTEYVFQGVPMRHAVQMRDRAKNKYGILNEENYYAELMKNVIVEPKVDWSYFDDHQEDFEPVLKIAANIANNKSPHYEE